MAVASLVLGIISILTSIIPVIGFILAIVALIIAIIVNHRKKDKEKNRGIKIAAVVLSIIAFIIALIITGITVFSAIIYTNDTKATIDATKIALLEESINNLKSALAIERLKLMTDNVDVDKKEAEEIYLNILKTDYTDLYNMGYRIKVNEDLTVEIIEPTN